MLLTTFERNVERRNITWGAEILNGREYASMNLVIPEDEQDILNPENNNIDLYIKASYNPVTRPVLLRVKCGDINIPFNLTSFFFDVSDDKEIKACQLPILNMGGNFMIRLIKSEYESTNGSVFGSLFPVKFASEISSYSEEKGMFGDIFPVQFSEPDPVVTYKAIIFGGGEMDIVTDESHDQEAQLLSLCAPGNLYRFPISGIDAFKYVNSVPSLTDLGINIIEQFESDGKSVSAASFDADSGNIFVEFTVHEQSESIENTVSQSKDSYEFDDADLLNIAETLVGINQPTPNISALMELADLQRTVATLKLQIESGGLGGDTAIPEPYIQSLFPNQ